MFASTFGNRFASLVVVTVLLGGFFFATTNVSCAAGLVPCDGLDCTTCDFATLANNIIKVLFGFVALIFGVMMLVAGFGLVTSGGNPAALNDAKSKFTNAIIGLLIMMSAWLLVDTLMRALLVGDNGEIQIGGWGPWSQIRCNKQTETQEYVDLNTGHGGPAVVPPGEGQSPGSTGPTTCSIPALTEMTDPLAIEMEKGNAVIFNNPTLEKCAKKFVQAVGGGARINSAYRPQQYQTHLWEIKDRWCDKGLKTNTEAACDQLKAGIGSEVTKHFGNSWSCGAVGATSKHTSGIAVDIGGISNHADPGVRTKAEENCLNWRDFSGDPWHYELMTGCSCD